MSKEGKFFVYCLEIYKQSKGITGKQAIELFQQNGITEYVYDMFEVLHIHGNKYIVEEIDEFIKKQSA